MPWLQLKFEAQSDSAEWLSALLEEAGASAVTLQDAADQPLYEPPPGATPLWSQTWVCGLFEADADMDAVLAQIRQALGQTPLPPWQLNPLEDKDWARAWMDEFKPMRFGEKLWICPSTFEPPEPEAVNIILDPGLAFGTGTHPTTAMCLQWLDGHPPLAQQVIDYGCGSGVLAIAACKLGAQSVIAVDNDPQALVATQENARRNKAGACIHPCLPEHCPQETVQLLIANILAGPLQELAPLFARLLRPGGDIVLSGVLESQAEGLMQTYSEWFDIHVHEQQDEWICLEGQRKH